MLRDEKRIFQIYLTLEQHSQQIYTLYITDAFSRYLICKFNGRLFIPRMYVFMLRKYTYILSFLFVTLLIMSCHNDIGEVNPATEQNNQITVPLSFGEIDGELIGYVFDNANSPVANAKVSIYSGETYTNAFGVFTFENTMLDPQGTFIKVEKAGYLLGSDLVYPNTNGKGTARVMMLKVVNEPTFQASEGGKIEITGGGTLTFAPSSLIRANGSIYDGEVKSTAYRLSPTDSDLGVKMSGGLLGIDQEGRHRVLSTYGGLAIELRGFDNQKLRLKSDKVAELSFPIENDIQSSVEEDVPVWSFDFTDGLWHESTASTNDKQNFTTSINELGFWNFALPNAISQICGKMIYDNELPAKNYVVQIISNGLPSRIGITDQNGYFCGKVPLGENLKFQVLHPACGAILEEISIGPFENVGTIGDVILDVDEKYISGTIECSGVNNSNSTILVESNNQTNIFYPNANGSFSINLDEILCGTSTYSLFAYDNDTEMSSEPLELTSEFSENVRLEICGSECLALGTFSYEKDDYCNDGDYSRIIVEITGGSGDYTYQWDDGSSDVFSNNPNSNTELCVKVNDAVSGCDYTFCDDVPSFRSLKVESIYSSNTECQQTSGFIDLDLEGGKEPILFEWTGPEGYTSNAAQISDLSPGTYNLLVQDGGGCQVIETILVYDVTTPIQSDIEDECFQSIITIEEDEGYKPYVYNWDGGTSEANKLFVTMPGVYRLTVTDANMCTRRTSITLSRAGLLPVINVTNDCEEGSVIFSDLEAGYEYYYQNLDSSDKIPLNMVQGEVNISILESGYRFELGAQNLTTNNCFTSELVELPRFEGLEIGLVTPESCESCADGSIEYDINIDDECISCIPGEVKVIRSIDEEDVTILNEEKQLENGEYFVIVLDSNSECYIAHSRVIVE